MKNSLKIFLLLLTYVLIAVCTFGVVTYIYQVPVPYINDINYQLYGGIGAGVLGLILGFVAAFARGKKAKATQEVVKASEMPEEVKKETEEKEEMKLAEEAAVEKTVTETPVIEETQPVETAEEVADEEEEVSIDVPEETKAAAEEVAEEIAPVEEQAEDMSEEQKIEPDDITRAFAPVVEPVEPLNNPVPTVIVSPLGPRNIKKDEVIEEVVSDEELANYSEPEVEEIREPEEIKEPEAIEDVFALEQPEKEEVKAEVPVPQPLSISETQENYIGESSVSYIDDEGKPQFVITQNMETVREIPEEEKKKNFVGYDVQAERRAQMASTLNKILTIIMIAALLAGIYFVYTKYLG